MPLFCCCNRRILVIITTLVKEERLTDRSCLPFSINSRLSPITNVFHVFGGVLRELLCGCEEQLKGQAERKHRGRLR